MPTFRDGTANILGFNNPGVYVDVIPPTPFLTGAPTNIEGLVGVASWGPVGTPTPFSTPDDGVGKFGLPMIRTYDMMTHAYAASQVGGNIQFMGVRVSDGTDVAASATVQTNGGTATGKFTGSRGNLINLGFQAGAGVGSFAAIVSFPGRAPERFDNLSSGLLNATVTPGTGNTAIPGVLVGPPNSAINAIQATATVNLKLLAAPTVSAGGSAYVVNDTVTLTGGITAAVSAVTSGAITAVTIAGAGQGRLIGPPGTLIPSGTLSVIGTSGIGTGATFTIAAFGIGDFTVTNPGQGYTSAPTLTLIGGGGTGTLTAATISFWAGLANAINNGTNQRGPSAYILFTAGSSVTAPTLNVATTLSGGTDGAAGVGSAAMLGQDTLPRKGMFALRNTKCDGFDLCDVTDTTTWATQLAFATSETMWAAWTRPSGGSIASAVADRQTAALDDPNFWLADGDWPTFFDTANGFSRLVSPQAYQIGLAGNLSPEQSPINKPIGGVVATQTSMLGLIIADADESQAQTGGIDVIGKSAALNETFFSFLTGRNGSSNTAANGMEFTRLTNFLARSLEAAATRSIVGKLQSIRPDDPTRQQAKFILDSFFQALTNPAVGSNGYGLIDAFSVQCDINNNPPNLQALGFLFAYCTVRYLNVVRFFVIKLAGGGNVSVQVQNTPPTPAQFASS